MKKSAKEVLKAKKMKSKEGRVFAPWGGEPRPSHSMNLVKTR